MFFNQLMKQFRQLLENITNIFKQRRLQAAQDEQEAERLDRIRNPEKYRGK